MDRSFAFLPPGLRSIPAARSQFSIVGHDVTDETDGYHDDAASALIDKYVVGRVEIGPEGWAPFILPAEVGWMHRDGKWTQTATALRKGSKVILLPRKDEEKPEKTPLRPSMADITPQPSLLDAREQRRQSLAFQKLHKKVKDAAFIKPATSQGTVLSYLVWHQLNFTAHDLGHMGFTHNWYIDRAIAIFIADICGGLSIGWSDNLAPSPWVT
ncbi:hypothetical protein BKA62DRAFT_793199 [Auriculariales sp. MPI-PUGE-AT-0066]|nr:hypothetical protein BKA62DRAFT_793199 [Auriculariales sp. MPI-PUGE-AT-0066]